MIVIIMMTISNDLTIVVIMMTISNDNDDEYDNSNVTMMIPYPV